MAKLWFNENDPFAAQWLRNLWPSAVVDERSIKELSKDDLRSGNRHHFFGGIGGWELALELAGWPFERGVWTGSCPCQPFSAAGKQKGNKDDRHLWPEWFRLIRECKPPTIFGEQVGAATVVGRVDNKNKSLQEMRDREAVFRVLRQLERQSPMGLQDLRADRGTGSQEEEATADFRELQRLADCEAGICSCQRSAASSQEAGIEFQLGPAGYTKSDRPRLLRVDGHPIRPDSSSGLECSVVGSNGCKDGIYHGQCTGDPIFCECDGEHLGSRQDYGDCVGDHGESQEGIQRLIRQAWTSSPEAVEPVWFDGVRADLESEGYTVRTCILGAHSVGAPHIRQRLWWVAVANGRGCRPDGPTGWGRSNGSGAGNYGRPAVANAGTHVGVAQSPGRNARSGDLQQSGEHGLREENGSVGRGPSGRIGEGKVWSGGVELPPGNGRLERGAEPGGQGVVGGCGAGGLGFSIEDGNQPRWVGAQPSGSASEAGSDGFWSDYELIPCADGKSRRIIPNSQLLVDGFSPELAVLCPSGTFPQRVGMLRGLGNAIVPAVAAEFIKAFLEVEGQP